MNVRRLVALGVAILIACATSPAWATYIAIKTNDNGADTEVREDNNHANPITTPVDPMDPFGETITHNRGLNRGSATEIATRAGDTTTTATGDQSSMFYVKFDISGLPDQNDSFWNDKQARMRLHVDNRNLGISRIYDLVENNQSKVQVTFNVYGLEPSPFKNNVDASGGYRYGDDDASAFMRQDLAGNDYDSSQYKYNWDEGTTAGGHNGTLPDGITFYDAPGITPGCVVTSAGNCTTAEGLGTLAENINSDARLLGTWSWPKVFPRNHLPIGGTLEFKDDDIKQLILDAKTNGRDYVTLMVAFGLDPTRESVAGSQPTPNNFTAFNYIAVPKERTLLNADNDYDPDGGRNGTLFPQSADNYHSVNNPGGDQEVGSPFSCEFNLTTRPQCTGRGDNGDGTFSPKLIVQTIPEPASVALLALGVLAALGIVRRRK